MSIRRRSTGEFTGRHMLIITLTFFGVIVAVNMTMATLARSSWTGLVVQNSYVASQQFNRKAEEGRAQAALHWQGMLTVADGVIRYALVDADGKPVLPASVRVAFRHPAYDAEDRTIDLVPEPGGTFSTRQAVRDGAWIVEVDADVGRGSPYRQVQRVFVRGGAIQ
ncbi:MAG TPA: FixH family protein [Mesorhizobium sp.]|jgi:nitrogen fixation protein FixH|uniref:FixH family protein n=1 Tax=Mesorhizobium sp. TaxID=1871066 RepID=UPI002DDCEA97|nr:FixH family protein [Mesorhizobium sp.]HEV2507241.1 FixH family protein [Mesorhizobium sp.]